MLVSGISNPGRRIAHVLLALVAALVAAMAAVPGTGHAFEHGETWIVSIGGAERLANNASNSPAISSTGRYIAFASLASNLVRSDTNRKQDIFVRDRRAGITTRISVSSDERQANGESGEPSISGDGRYVAFSSRASNLVARDTNMCSYASGATLPCRDVFVRDRQTGTTRRVSVSSSGQQGNFDSFSPSISANGRYVAFVSGTSNLAPGDTATCFEGDNCEDIFVHDLKTRTTTIASVSSSERQGSGYSSEPSINADGRYVAFRYSRFNSNLVPGRRDIFGDVLVRDRREGTTIRASVSSSERQANAGTGSPSISANGRYVAFDSMASNLVPGDTAQCGNARGDVYNCSDVFVRDLASGRTSRASVSSSEAQARGEERGSYDPSISGDGRYVAFASDSSNLVKNDTNKCFDTANCDDVFRRDRVAGKTERASVSNSGASGQGNAESRGPAISRDGLHVTFESLASNFIGADDTNGKQDIFVRTELQGDEQQ